MRRFAPHTLALAVTLAVLAAVPPSGAEEAATGGGEVRVPLGAWERLVEQARAARTAVRGTAPGYALGKADLRIAVTEIEGRMSAEATLTLSVRTLEDQWTPVVLLPGGTAVTHAEVNGSPVQLVAGADGLAWTTKEAGTYAFVLGYRADARRSEGGFSLALPVPPGAPIELNATLPGSDLDVAVVPAVGLRVSGGGSATSVTASLPPGAGVQILWRPPGGAGHVLSRARYEATLEGSALAFKATYGVEIFSGDSITLPLLPRGITLRDVSIDGRRAAVLSDGARFTTVVRGRGAHEVVVAFEAPVVVGQGPPAVHLQIPEVPVSRFDLSLPGRKEVTVTPAASVATTTSAGRTLATVYVPMTSALTFSWSEAVPEAAEERVRANASLYHVAHAEEGVVHVRALVVFEITHGETNLFELAVPRNVQINRIVAPTGGVADWRLARTGSDDKAEGAVKVFLDRNVKGEYRFDVEYERLLGKGSTAAGAEAETVEVPLLQARGVHRQRGMVALLSGAELTLNPVEELRVNKVGENQLPAWVREAVPMTVAHTYKYADADPRLLVRPVAPERKQGKYAAQVDTLVSIGEVTMKGSATVEVNVKSGALMELVLAIPTGVTLLGVTGPSIRTHQLKAEAANQQVEIAFTQEMDGQFRLEVSYERILVDGEAEVSVPTVSVVGADVEHGRIAVEALAAVEVQPAATDQLSTVDVNELPQQLVLKTTNPILLAYKYVHVDPPFRLALRVTRHQELDVQAATIDEASYSTLFTRDGLAVTRAVFTVRNSRRQFLKIELPPSSEVWSVFVAGRAEKPALATDSTAGTKPDSSAPPQVLVQMINSADGFPVEVVYATKIAAMGSLGSIGGRLPRPDMVATHTRWDVFLPDGIAYRQPTTNMDVVAAGAPVDQAAMEEQLASTRQRDQAVTPLRIHVPTRGLHWAFEKLYANQSEEHASFSVAYSSRTGGYLAALLALCGTLALWAGAALAATGRLAPGPALALAGGGLAVVAFAVGYLGTSLAPVAAISVLALAALAGWRMLEARGGRSGGTA